MRGSVKWKMVKKYAIGILVLVLLTASIYILYPDNVRIDVGKTYSTFKVWESDSWVLAGQEYSLMFDGTKKMRASSRTIESFVNENIVTIIRTANFKNNVTVIDTYTFDGNEKDVKLFPISHDINVLNGVGYILVYEVTKLDYSGETIKDILSPQEFGHNMRIEWEDGNYYSRIWGYANRDEGKLTIKYRLDSADFTKQVKLFDPPKVIRTLQTDTTCVNGKCTAIGYLNQVNIEYNGEFIPVEDYLEVEFADNKLKFKTLDNKECEFELEYEKVDVLDTAQSEAVIIEHRGGYYFTTDTGTEVNSMNYKINCVGFNLSFENNKFWMDEFYVDFNQAEEKQNISTYYNEKDNILEFSIVSGKTGSLSMIDPTTGVTSPGTMADDNAVGTVAWSSVDNAKISDNSYASAVNGVATITTHYLKATNFGFSIPVDATIDGIEATIERQRSSGGVPPDTIFDTAVKIVKSDGSIGSEDKSKAPEWTQSSDTIETYGGSSDLWSETWSDTDINDLDFGVVLSADLFRAFGSGVTALVDHITIEVTYTEAAPSDSCTCAGAGNNWEVNMSHSCNLTSACTLTTGNLTWIGLSGFFNCSAQLNLTNRDAPISSTIFYYSSGCEVNRE